MSAAGPETTGIVERASTGGTFVPAAPAPPSLEERALPPLAAEWLRELLLRHEREVNAAMERVAQEIGLTLSEGWGVDLDGRRFVRAAPPTPTD